MISIVLAEDHTIVREGFRAILDAEPDLTVIGEAEDGLEAVELTRAKTPDVLVVDLMMPGLNGLDVIQQVRQHSPETRIVVLSMYDNEAYVLEALRHGASGYVLKNAEVSELKQAIRSVMQDRRYLATPLSEQAIERYLQAAQEDDELRDLYSLLTPREREVFHLTVEGGTSREIGKRLTISPRTVEKHQSNIMQKLGRHSKAELIEYAMQCGLIEPPPLRGA